MTKYMINKGKGINYSDPKNKPREPYHTSLDPPPVTNDSVSRPAVDEVAEYFEPTPPISVEDQEEEDSEDEEEEDEDYSVGSGIGGINGLITIVIMMFILFTIGTSVMNAVTVNTTASPMGSSMALMVTSLIPVMVIGAVVALMWQMFR